MDAEKIEAAQVEALMTTPGLAEALEDDRFKQFLDLVPVAIAVAEVPSDQIAYANIEFERLTGQSAGELQGRSWGDLAVAEAEEDGQTLGEAIVTAQDHVGSFRLDRDGAALTIDAWSNLIEDNDGSPMFRLVALAAKGIEADRPEALAQRMVDADILLGELQHRVKNNLQMITALIRLESRGLPDDATKERFDRLAGRIEALGILYRTLGIDQPGATVDLGTYLSEVASAVMKAHAVEGIRLQLQVDAWPVAIDVAMPAGLVVNELLTNSLKHAFSGREGGTISLSSVIDGEGCRIVVADDGNGLAEGDQWPRKGKLGNLIVKSLEQNARASVRITSVPAQGVRAEIFFARADAGVAAA